MSWLCRQGLHNWRRDCEKCSRCGAKRKDVHQWDGPRCKKCGKAWEKTFCLIYANDYRGENLLYQGDRVIYLRAERCEKNGGQYVFFDKQGARLASFPVYDSLGLPSVVNPPERPLPRYFVTVSFKSGCPECSPSKARPIKLKLEYSLADGPDQPGQWWALGFVCPHCGFHWSKVSTVRGPRPPRPDIESLVWTGKDKLGFTKGGVSEGCTNCGRRLTVHRMRCEDPDGPMYHAGVCAACGTQKSD